MRHYKRHKNEAYQIRQRTAIGHVTPKTVPIAHVQPLVQRQSLLRLQTGLAGLLRNRQRIEMRLGKAVAAKQWDRVKVLAKLHLRSTENAQALVAEIDKRSGEVGKPRETLDKPKTRRVRATENHSKVRRGDPSSVPSQLLEPKPKPKPSATRDIEHASQATKEAFKAELERRLKA